MNRVRLGLVRLAVLLLTLPAPVLGQSFSSPSGSSAAAQQDATKTAHPLDFHPSSFNLSVRGGLGLIYAISPETLAPGELAVNGFELNYDRNPGDVDFFEFGFQISLGLPRGWEGFLRVSPTLRANSVGQHPVTHPVPPLDLFVDTYPTDAARSQPFSVFAQEVPFKTYPPERVIIAPPGDGAFSSSQGDVIVGLKKNLFSQSRGDRVGFGVRGYLELPVEKPHYNTVDWRRFAGVSGEIDAGFDLLWSKQIWSGDSLLNLGYKRVGDPDRGLRLQFVDSSQVDTDGFLVGEPIDFPLNLRDEISLHAGSAFPVVTIMGQQLWLLTEFSMIRYLGNGTKVERLVHPVELRFGAQLNFPWYKPLSIGMAWQLLLNNAGDGDTRTTQFRTPDGRGDINFGELIDSERFENVSAFLINQGAEFTHNSSRVFATDNPTFDAWRNIPTAPETIIGQGGGNILAFLTWRIGAYQ